VQGCVAKIAARVQVRPTGGEHLYVGDVIEERGKVKNRIAGVSALVDLAQFDGDEFSAIPVLIQHSGEFLRTPHY
jgi:hypothetical protein